MAANTMKIWYTTPSHLVGIISGSRQHRVRFYQSHVLTTVTVPLSS
jgi:hypothetical protein